MRKPADNDPGFVQTVAVQDSVSVQLRQIPSIDRVLADLGPIDLPRPVVVDIVRRELDGVRDDLKAGKFNGSFSSQNAVDRVRQALEKRRRARLQPVINGTGVIIHTNFGRSPLGGQVIDAIVTAASQYNNLEFDLAEGARGGRAQYLEQNVAMLCGAQAATVVNNCAAALVLILRHFASAPPNHDVVISRGELVQIGGGFRIPDILQASGARLREIGTTNITTIADYQESVGQQTALILKVHQSNFAMAGFADRPSTADLAALARKAGVPIVEDLGSGATFDTRPLGGAEHEPTPAIAISQGADLVCFSGDKLLGGPQAGIIAGKATLIDALKKNPIYRALRCDKLILSALEKTVDLLLDGKTDGIPIREMMETPIDALRRRADAIIAQLWKQGVKVEQGEGQSRTGGGSLPLARIPSITLDLWSDRQSADAISAALRRSTPPLIAYIADDRVKIDLRTVFASQDSEVIRIIGSVMR